MPRCVSLERALLFLGEHLDGLALDRVLFNLTHRVVCDPSPLRRICKDAFEHGDRQVARRVSTLRRFEQRLDLALAHVAYVRRHVQMRIDVPRDYATIPDKRASLDARRQHLQPLFCRLFDRHNILLCARIFPRALFENILTQNSASPRP